MSTGNKLDQDLNKFIGELVNESENYTHFLKISTQWVKNSNDVKESEETVERIKEELIFIKQCLMYLNVMQDEAKLSIASIDEFAAK